MTIKKPAIPAITVADASTGAILAAMKDNIEILTGVRKGTGVLPQLASTATNTDIINKINAIIVRLNSTGS